jgi:hypothetical protein
VWIKLFLLFLFLHTDKVDFFYFLLSVGGGKKERGSATVTISRLNFFDLTNRKENERDAKSIPDRLCRPPAISFPIVNLILGRI